ncbi:hypothetical protein KDH_72260 [Dictyobacter sp. S3.2.2.5]|uniref:Uncharacterized protein n=1 Tax=Dictyobacter halimunensis TaxID=3026934 RepID=A0ABQ6G717_9CHLR|nr:hypothetical protein KDH_72260 [Dictyobacter sp. S3.2.2.5]
MHISYNQAPVKRRWTLYVYATLAGLILLGILAQGFLIGTALFANDSWGQTAHGAVGLSLLLLTLLLPLVGLLAQLPRELSIGSAILFALTLLEVMLAGLARSVPLLAALHPTNAMLMSALNIYLLFQAWNMIQGKRTSEVAVATTDTVENRKKEEKPLEINLTTGAYLLFALISLAVLTLFIINRPQVVNAVRAMQPNSSQGEIDAAVATIQLIVIGAHAIFGSASIILAFLLRTGKNWARIVASILSGLVILEIIYEWSSPTDVPAVLAPNQRLYAVIVQLLMIMMMLACAALVWVSPASHAFFAPRPK